MNAVKNSKQESLKKATTGNQSKISPDQLVSEIQKRAHEIYLERGDASSSDFDDWINAEKQVKAKLGIAI